MSELRPLQALIVDDEQFKIHEIQSAFEAEGGTVALTANRVGEVVDYCSGGELTAESIDVAFIDSRIGTGDGKEVVRHLGERGLVRNDAEPDPSKIVVVGCSYDTGWARELGSYSETQRSPLIVDWSTFPLRLAHVVSEVRHMKHPV